MGPALYCSSSPYTLPDYSCLSAMVQLPARRRCDTTALCPTLVKCACAVLDGGRCVVADLNPKNLNLEPQLAAGR